MDTWLEQIRRAELEPLRSFIPARARVLEVGGGSGFQASILASWGCDVVSIDIARSPSAAPFGFSKQYFPVREYDGKHFPFGDEEFDVVFSSHMLYLVIPLGDFLCEIQRVLKRGGLAMHVVPSSGWRWWTSVSHYADIARVLMRKANRRVSPSQDASPRSVAAAPLREPFRRRLQRLLRPAPIGPQPSALSELWRFRRTRWVAEFRDAGYDAIACAPNHMFFTGHALLPGVSVQLRRRLSRFLGSSAFYVTMRRP